MDDGHGDAWETSSGSCSRSVAVFILAIHLMEYILLCLKRKSRQLKRRPSAKENVMYGTYEDSRIVGNIRGCS